MSSSIAIQATSNANYYARADFYTPVLQTTGITVGGYVVFYTEPLWQTPNQTMISSSTPGTITLAPGADYEAIMNFPMIENNGSAAGITFQWKNTTLGVSIGTAAVLISPSASAFNPAGGGSSGTAIISASNLSVVTNIQCSITYVSNVSALGITFTTNGVTAAQSYPRCTIRRIA